MHHQEISQTKRNRNEWNRERVCASCGKVELVRKDNLAPRCKQCAAKHSADERIASGTFKFNKPPRGWFGPMQPNCKCDHCGLRFYRSPSGVVRAKKIYCSRECKVASCQVERECKHCKKKFVVGVSRLGEKTNSSANFCSRPCYETWLCDTERTKKRGSRWHVISREVKKAAPFCAWCGKSHGRIEVHHITPYRITNDNGKDNLIPLCSSCHKKIEFATVEAENESGKSAAVFSVINTMLRFRQFATYQLLKRISNERKHEAA